MARLFLRCRSVTNENHLDPDVDWLVRGDDGTDVEGHVPLSALAEVIESHARWADDPDNVVLFVPTDDVLAVTCEVPGRNTNQIRRAVPYAVEEFVADDIDTMHVACAELRRGEPVHALIAARERVHEWLSDVSASGAAPGYMTADALALPSDDDSVVALIDGDRVLLRAGSQIASVDRPNLVTALGVLRGGLGEQASLHVVNGLLSDAEFRGSGFAADEVAHVGLEHSLLGYLASEFEAGEGINLLQGDFAVRRRPRGVWARWRPVAAAAGMWLAIGLGFLFAQGIWANHQAGKLRGQAEALYREIYQVERVVGNPADRMRRQLGQTPLAAPGFHDLMGRLGVGLGEIVGRHEVRRLQYSARRGLDAELVVDDDAVLERLGTVLREQGLNMEVLSTDSAQTGGRIGARVRVTLPE